VALVCTVVGQPTSGGQTGVRAGQGAPATGQCRTYDTSTTAVTVAGPLTATVTSAGVYDPWARRFTQNVTYSDNRGIRYSYVQVTTYQSAEDFIAEVVRLKAPAPLSSNPTGPATNIVPPLTRSLGTTASGTMAFTLENTYDTQGRLTQVVSTVPQGSVTTRYTAWDSFGRPTSGTLQSAASSSTLALAYDDKARTLTTNPSTRSLLAVGTRTFDGNGNPTLYMQRASVCPVSTTTTTSGSTATACLGDMRVPTAPAVAARPGPSPNGTLSGSIGGSPWAATLGVQAGFVSPILSVGGGDNRYLVSCGLAVNRGPGEYTTGSVDPDKVRTMDQEAFKETFASNTVIATVFDSVTKRAWQASPTFGSGTLTVTSLSGTGASGSFSLTLEPTPGTGASLRLAISGTFNVRF
jgi:YD repeat-containing protein